MDPLTALGLAGNLIQIVDFSCKLFSSSRSLYASATGTSSENIEIEAIAIDLERLNVNLQASLQTNNPCCQLSSSDQALVELSKACQNLARELIKALEDLKINGPHRKWKSLHQALRSIWAEEHISAKVNRLSAIREELNSRVLIDLRLAEIILCLSQPAYLN